MDRFNHLFFMLLSVAFAYECPNETVFYIDLDSTSSTFGKEVSAGQCGCLSFSQDISGSDSSVIISLNLFENEPSRGFQFTIAQESMGALDYQWSKTTGKSKDWDVWDFKNPDGSVALLGADLEGKQTNSGNNDIFLDVMYKIVKKPPTKISFYLRSDKALILSDVDGENLLCSYPSIDMPAIFEVNWLSSQIKKSKFPDRFILYPNYPNPFNPSTTISFDLPYDSDVRVFIYDIIGRNIAVLIENKMIAGKHSIQWNGLTKLGESVPSGIYYVVINAGKFSQTNKMTFLR
ncbi:MAG: hypothetical protein CMG75_10215 [Candidatus Marinimicrobia bacterium]|nr:hypothetical protein [Candidatus Neomarinimicrobiota bacterium]|tara:strand:+ start:13643 stop:14515 length:873 start_codon:yes stop_codon:yes gene_type:complete